MKLTILTFLYSTPAFAPLYNTFAYPTFLIFNPSLDSHQCIQKINFRLLCLLFISFVAQNENLELHLAIHIQTNVWMQTLPYLHPFLILYPQIPNIFAEITRAFTQLGMKYPTVPPGVEPTFNMLGKDNFYINSRFLSLELSYL